MTKLNKKVVLFLRNSSDGFSIEGVFTRLFGKTNNPKLTKPKFKSHGFFNRILIIAESFFRSSNINHVTGDINFIIPFLRGKKIITIHDIGILYDLKGIKKNIYSFFWFYLPIKFSNIITVVSNETKKELLKKFNIKESKIKVIYNPLLFSNSKVKNNFKINDIPKILIMGTKENKNLKNIVLAIKGLNVRLNIIGQLSSAQKKILKNNNIKYDNSYNLNYRELEINYLNSDFLLFPSTYEGFGLPIIEAQSCGLPVITSNTSSMPEIGGLDGALYIDPYNPSDIRRGILKLINNENLRNNFSVNGLNNIKRFDVEKIKLKYMSLYSSII